MLTLFNGFLRTAARTDSWDTPDHWGRPRRRPISDEDARRIDQVRRSMHYRAPW